MDDLGLDPTKGDRANRDRPGGRCGNHPAHEKVLAFINRDGSRLLDVEKPPWQVGPALRILDSYETYTQEHVKKIDRIYKRPHYRAVPCYYSMAPSGHYAATARRRAVTVLLQCHMQ